MSLEDIGFYTLSEERAKRASSLSPMWRGEILITDRCNFACPYCRKLRADIAGERSLEEVKAIIDALSVKSLKNIRFSGGEPTLHRDLLDMVLYAKSKGVERIAISTNGSADIPLYKGLISSGLNDISISLDSCCSSTGKKMCGGVTGAWEKVVENIRLLSGLTYVTLGVVFTDDNISRAEEIIKFGSSLGVADIRVVSAAQQNEILSLEGLDNELLSRHPILRYRVNNYKTGRNVRGISAGDSNKCALVLDDAAIAGEYHFPCIIYLREGGDPIGKVGFEMRKEREKWFINHDSFQDKICKNNCLDVCIDYNNAYRKHSLLPELNPSLFDWQSYRNGRKVWTKLGVISRKPSILAGRKILRKLAVGYCDGEKLPFRKKEEKAVMFDIEGEKCWTHFKEDEFQEVFA